MTEDAARFGDPRLPAETITSQSHLFHLTALPPTTYDGGTQQQAHEDNFPILKGQEASIQLITLQPGGIREPHWHPSAWEINLVTKGVATWVLIDGNGNHESFDAHVDDIVFAPQGSLHYFENRGTGDLDVLIIQNTSAPEDKDNIGDRRVLKSASTRGVVRRLRCSRRDVQLLQKVRQRGNHPAIALARTLPFPPLLSTQLGSM